MVSSNLLWIIVMGTSVNLPNWLFYTLGFAILVCGVIVPIILYSFGPIQNN